MQKVHELLCSVLASIDSSKDVAGGVSNGQDVPVAVSAEDTKHLSLPLKLAHRCGHLKQVLEHLFEVVP
jgi:hypothetical protein